MFKAEIKADTLKEMIRVISTLIDEAKFQVGPEGLKIKAVDPAHVADLSLSAEAFESYQADEMEIGVDIDKLNEVVKLSGGQDIIAIRYDEEKNRLVIKTGNITRRMALVDTAGMSDPKIPNLNLPAKVVLKASELTQGIKASESISDHLSLIVNPEGFELSSQGDQDSVNLKLHKDLLEDLEAKETAKSLFSLDYFANMIKSVGQSESVTLFMGSDYPVKMEFLFADGKGEVVYLLAPRIESE